MIKLPAFDLDGTGGNDERVYLSDFGFITIDNYLDFPEKVKFLLA